MESVKQALKATEKKKSLVTALQLKRIDLHHLTLKTSQNFKKWLFERQSKFVNDINRKSNFYLISDCEIPRWGSWNNSFWGTLKRAFSVQWWFLQNGDIIFPFICIWNDWFWVRQTASARIDIYNGFKLVSTLRIFFLAPSEVISRTDHRMSGHL